MNVGSVSRAQALEVPSVPVPTASTAPPLDLGRDVVVTDTPTVSPTAGLAPVRTEPARTAPFVDPQLHRAAEAFTRGGLGGLDTWLHQHPADARWLLSVPRDQLTQGLEDALASRYGGFLGPVHAFHDARAIEAHLVDVTQPQIREAVRQTAVGRIDGMTRALTSSSPEQLTTALRAAPPGSELAALGTALGLQGDAGDVRRVALWRDRALGELAALRSTVMGQAWMPEELPGSMAHVQRAMGLERATPGSIAGQAFFRGGEMPDARAHRLEAAMDGVLVAAEVAELATEAVHLAAHGGAAALAAEAGLAASAGGVALGLGGLAFGVVLHHQIEHNRSERTEIARALGL
jgi:hypothetical protein